jgi:hypothetical protein
MSWETFYDDIATWIEDVDEPHFLWVFLVDPHLPYIPVDEYCSRSKLIEIRRENPRLQSWDESPNLYNIRH